MFFVFCPVLSYLTPTAPLYDMRGAIAYNIIIYSLV